jgi:hypothetical protein
LGIDKGIAEAPMILALSYVAVGAVTLAVMLWCGAVLVEPGPMAEESQRFRNIRWACDPRFTL